MGDGQMPGMTAGAHRRRPQQTMPPDRVMQAAQQMNQPVTPQPGYQMPYPQMNREMQQPVPPGMAYQQIPMQNPYAAVGQNTGRQAVNMPNQGAYPQQVRQNPQPNSGWQTDRRQSAGQERFSATGGYVPPAHVRAAASGNTGRDKTNGIQRSDTQGFSPAVLNGGNNSRKKGFPVGKLVFILAVLAVIAGGLIFGIPAAEHAAQVRQMTEQVEAFNSVFCNGVYVDGIHLGGMTTDEAMNAVNTQAQNRNNSWHVNLILPDGTSRTLRAGDLGMSVDIVDTMNAAWRQGHEGTIEQRKAAMDAMLTAPYTAYTAAPSGSSSLLDSILSELETSCYRPAKDARLSAFDPNLSYPFIFEDEQMGQVLDVNGLKTTLYRMVSSMTSGDVQITPNLIQPNVTVEQLKTGLAMRSSVYTPISTKSTTERTNNIRRCFEQFSGYILAPGASFSFNNVVGKRTKANGFYSAIEYAYGEQVEGVGGGSCQASTTLYQAAVLAGLQIVSREPHSDSVSYAEYGQDATVYWESNRKIDFVFKNNTDGPIYIVAAVQADPSNRKRFVARVTMYGQDMGDVRYELVSEQVKELPAPTTPEYVKDTKHTHVTYTDETYTARKAKAGVVVQSYRVKYENNTQVQRTLLFTDTYEAKAERIYVGTKSR